MSANIAKSFVRSSSVSNTIVAPAVLGAAHLGCTLVSGQVHFNKSKSSSPAFSVLMAGDQQPGSVESKLDSPPMAELDEPGINLRVETESDGGGHLYQDTLCISLKRVEPPKQSNPALNYQEFGPFRSLTKIKDPIAVIHQVDADVNGLPGADAEVVLPLPFLPGPMSTKRASKELITAAKSVIAFVAVEGHASQTLTAIIQLSLDKWCVSTVVANAKHVYGKEGQYAFRIEHIVGTQTAYLVTLMVDNTTIFVLGFAHDEHGVQQVCRYLRPRDVANLGPVLDMFRVQLHDIECSSRAEDYDSASIDLEAWIEPPNPTTWRMTPIPRKVTDIHNRVPHGNCVRFDLIGTDDALATFHALNKSKAKKSKARKSKAKKPKAKKSSSDKSEANSDAEGTPRTEGPERGSIAAYAERVASLGGNPISMMGKAAFGPMVEVDEEVKEEEMLFRQGGVEAIELLKEYFLDPKNAAETPRWQIERDLAAIEAKRAKKGVESSERRVERAADHVQEVQASLKASRGRADVQAARNTTTAGLAGPAVDEPTNAVQPAAPASVSPPRAGMMTASPAGATPAAAMQSESANRRVTPVIDDGEPPAHIPYRIPPSPFAKQKRPAKPTTNEEPIINEVMSEINSSAPGKVHVTEVVGFKHEGQSDIGQPGSFVAEAKNKDKGKVKDKDQGKGKDKGKDKGKGKEVDTKVKHEQGGSSTAATGGPAPVPKSAPPPSAPAPAPAPASAPAPAPAPATAPRSPTSPSSAQKKQKKGVRGYATAATSSEARQAVPELPTDWFESSECARLCAEIDHCREGDEYAHVYDDDWVEMPAQPVVHISQRTRDWVRETQWPEEYQ